MGVIGAACQLCRLPLQHDHYVPSASAGMLKIYRGSARDGGHEWEPDERVVHFGREHAWLAEAVAITYDNRVVRGATEDGWLEDVMIWEGDDEGLAFHDFCFDLMGTPTRRDDAITSEHTHGAALIDAYCGQLFEMRELVDHGKGWALVDPRMDARSRDRIDKILAQARKRRQPRLATVADVLAADRDWVVRADRTADHQLAHIVRYHEDVHPELDCAAYPALVWAMKEYDGGGMPPSPEAGDELERYELSVKAAVEANDAAILLMTMIGKGQAQFIIHARDEAATRAAIEALPSGKATKPVSFENETDATWNLYFTKVAPNRRR